MFRKKHFSDEIFLKRFITLSFFLSSFVSFFLLFAFCVFVNFFCFPPDFYSFFLSPLIHFCLFSCHLCFFLFFFVAFSVSLHPVLPLLSVPIPNIFSFLFYLSSFSFLSIPSFYIHSSFLPIFLPSFPSFVSFFWKISPDC